MKYMSLNPFKCTECTKMETGGLCQVFIINFCITLSLDLHFTEHESGKIIPYWLAVYD